MKRNFPLSHYDPKCVRCDRLVGFLKQVKSLHPGYTCRPVPPFGSKRAKLLVVGLAPGLHGANATGRPFTGDHAGIMLFRTLYELGFSSAPESRPGDSLRLINCRITNAVKCLPPQNKPIADEINACRDFLKEELATVPLDGVVLALGRLSHDSILRAFGLSVRAYPFGHSTEYLLPDGRTLLSSYHCSRYNTQTRRLTDAMFRQVFKRARALIE